MNNLKIIRKLYGATQDEVALSIGVSRVTIAKWEGEFSSPTDAHLKKMAVFYGIDAPYFFELPIDDETRRTLKENGQTAREERRRDGRKRRDIDDLAVLMAPVTFDDAMGQYQLALKLLTAHAVEGTIGDLRTICELHDRMGNVLHNMLEQRLAEEDAAAQNKGIPLFELLDGE